MKIISAATVVLQKSTGEVLLGKRSSKVNYFPNAWVYPGGKIETEVDPDWIGNEEYSKNTAIQELFEEVGIIPTINQTFSSEQRSSPWTNHVPTEKQSEIKNLLHFIGRRQTPPFSNVIFDTAYFFLQGKLVDEMEASADGNEIIKLMWERPVDILSKYNNLEIILPPPTLHVIRLLNENNKDFIEKSLEESSLPYGLQTRVEFAPNIQSIPLPSNTAPPFTSTNLIIFEGDDTIVMVDPGWNDKANQVKDILKKYKDKKIKIILTHHHRDHTDGLTLVTNMLSQIKVIAHPFTLSKIETSLDIVELEEGEVVLTENGQPRVLKLLYTPGHTAGHLVVYDEKTRTIVAGDQVVGEGSSFLDPESGNMKDYLETCQKLIDLNARLIIPAHGRPNFNPNKLLKEYIDHRIEREKQIVSALKAGNNDIKTIVKHVYTDIPDKMFFYAEFNVKMHLKKLIDEDKVIITENIYQLK
jgi:endoribonuclease LACTB2